MESWDEIEVKADISNLQQRIQSFFAARHENRCIKWQQVEDFLILEKSLDHVEIEDNCILVTCRHAK
jgi:adenosyl cobinamide kinase/adenosyl cobinamide phosphate guanylyltransferase